MATKKQIRSAKAVSAPGPLTITNGDRSETFMVRPPTTADLFSFRKWLRKQPVPDGPGRGLSKEELAGLTPEQQAVLLDRYARAKAARRGHTEEEAMDIAHSPDGAAMMVWIAARKHHPGLQLKAVRDLITPENVDQVLGDFDDATGVEDETGDVDPKAPGSGC